MPEFDPRIAEILEELYARRDAGETVEPAECIRAHPDLRDELRRAFEVERLVPLIEGPSPGATLGRFRIEASIGRGGMGSVFNAWDPALSRRIALKVIVADPLQPTRTEERFVREAGAIGRLRHPNIVTVFENGAVGSYRYIAMELIEGGSLAGLLDKARRDGSHLDVGLVVQWMVSIADALAHAHGEGVVHRDLKPENILIDSEGKAYLTDFGLAQVEGDPQMTRSTDVLGTAFYTAPELILGAHDADGRSDVFSLGVTLYEATTLERPFDGSSAHEIRSAILRAATRPPRKHRPDLTRDLETIVLKCLERERSRRYSSAAAVAEDLRSFRDYRPIVARAPSSTRRVSLWMRRHPGAAAAAVLGGLLVAGALASAVYRARERRDVIDRQAAAAASAWGYGDFRLAQVHYQRILELDPDHAVAQERDRQVRGQSALDRAFLNSALLTDGPESPWFRPIVALSALDEAERLLGKGGVTAILRGLIQLVSGRPAESLRTLDAAVAHGATRGVLRLRALVHRHLGNGEEEGRDMARLGELPIESAEDALQDGLVLFFMDEKGEALQRFREVLAERPDDFWTLAHVLQVHLARRDNNSAIATATHCVALRRDFFAVYDWRAVAFARAGRDDLAAADMLRVQERVGDPLRAALMQLHYLTILRRSDEAAVAADAAVRRFPDSEIILQTAARIHRRTGRLDSALTLALRAVAVSGSAESRVLAGDVHRARREHVEASRLYRSAVARRPDFVPARVGEARCLIAREDLIAARRELDAALLIDGRSVMALLLRARVTAALGDLEAAGRDFLSVMGIAPHEDQARGGHAAIVSVTAEAGSPRAYAYAVEARRWCPDRSSHLFDRIAAVERRAKREALADTDLDHPLLLALRARLVVERGDTEKATDAYDEAAASTRPFLATDPVVERALGVLLARVAMSLGRTDEARSWFAVVLKSDATHPEARAFMTQRR